MSRHGLRVESCKVSDFGAASWQHPSPSERAAWLRGSSWVWRAARKRGSPPEEVVLASCAAAKEEGIFNVLSRLQLGELEPSLLEAFGLC